MNDCNFESSLPFLSITFWVNSRAVCFDELTDYIAIYKLFVGKSSIGVSKYYTTNEIRIVSVLLKICYYRVLCFIEPFVWFVYSLFRPKAGQTLNTNYIASKYKYENT